MRPTRSFCALAENMAFECVRNEGKSKVWRCFPLNKCVILDKNSAVLGVKEGQTCSMHAYKYVTLSVSPVDVVTCVSM